MQLKYITHLMVGLLTINILSVSGQNIDESFKMPLPVKKADINEIVWLENGKILVGGKIHFFENNRVKHLIRLNGDGSLDETFAHNEDFQIVRSIGTLPSNEILVGTLSEIYLLSENGNELSSLALGQDERLEKLIVDGSLIYVATKIDTSITVKRYSSELVEDDSFSTINLNGNLYDLDIHQGKVLITGNYLSINDQSLNPIVRFNTDNTLDEAFELMIEIPEEFGNIDNLSFEKSFIGSDDKISILSNGFNGILRLNEEGVQDESFEMDKTTFRHIGISGAHLDINNNFILISSCHYYNNNDSQENRILKYSYSGEIIDDFEQSNLTRKNNDPVLTTNDSGEILLGNINDLSNRYGLNKFSSVGELDHNFLPMVGTYGEIDIAEIKDDKFIIAGDFNRLDDFTTYDLAILNLDGTIERDFQFSENIGDTPSDIELYDGNIYLATKSEVHKVFSNGEKDLSFNSTPEFLFEGQRIVQFCDNIHIQKDGKIVTTSHNGLFRMKSDGNSDNTFGPFFPSAVTSAYDSDMQEDDKVIFAGNFDRFENADFQDIVKVNPDGSFDNSFNVVRDKSQERAPAIKHITSIKNEELVVIGYFNNFSGYETPHKMVKLKSDGSVDEHFLKFVDETFNVQAKKLSNYSRFRGGFVLSGFTDYEIIDEELIYDYQLFSFNNSGIFQSKFQLPSSYQATTNIIPLVITNNDVILLSKFISDDYDPIYGIRLKVNNLPKITSIKDDVVILDGSKTSITFDNLEVADSDNIYPDDFQIRIYSGENFTVVNNEIIPDVGYTGSINVPISVSDGSNESNFVMFPIQVGVLSAVSEVGVLELFPNPTSDVINISNDGEFTVEVMTVNGAIIADFKSRKQIDLSNLDAGIYIIRLIDSNKMEHTLRVVKK